MVVRKGSNRKKSKTALRPSSVGDGVFKKPEILSEESDDDEEIEEFEEAGFAEAAFDDGDSDDEGEGDGSDEESDGDENDAEEDDGGGGDVDEEESGGEDVEGEEESDGDGDDDGDEGDESGDSKNDDEEIEKSVDESERESDADAEEESKHKKSLSRLRKTDPEFFKFLQENDRKLLQFNASDSEAGSGDGDDDDEEAVHKPPSDLEVDSDESDFEDGKRSKPGSLVTLAMVQEWRKDLVENSSKESMDKAVEAFRAALDRVSGEENSTMKVESGAVFNAVIEMCVMNLQPAVLKFLKLSAGNLKNADKSKRWPKIKFLLQTYFTDLLKLLGGVASEHIVSVLLKHLHSMCLLVAIYAKLSRNALKHLTRLWSAGEETVSVLAYLCVVRLATSQKSNLLNAALKLLYIAYIRSSKFVSVNNLAHINFMRRSLSSLFSINQTLSYQHAFLYIRQLAIHLRNGVTLHKKENFQAIYNWQYIQSLKLWVDLLSSTDETSELHQLVYPLVQIIIGCIKLVPTAQYIPLRFHCIKLLVQLGRETDTYIPTLPFIVESLGIVDLNRQNKKVSMKPFDFTCVLRMSKAAMTENAFTDAIVENVYDLLVEATAANAHKISFPDMVLPAIFQLRAFVKGCKVGKYSAKLKQILSKIEENAKLVNAERAKLSVNIGETDKLMAFEKGLLVGGTPLSKFHEQWARVKGARAMKRATEKAKLETEITMPVVKKRKAVKKSEENSSGPVVLFPSDDEQSDDGLLLEENGEKSDVRKMPKKRNRRKKEPKQSQEEDDDVSVKDEPDGEDIVEDFKLSEF